MHIKSSLILNVLFLVITTYLLSACDSGFFSSHNHSPDVTETLSNDEASQKVNKIWYVSQSTQKEAFIVKLSCLQQPYVGDFQACHLFVKQAGKSISNAVIAIDGGMKAHGHGLPTSPKLSATDVSGKYKIEGLKFSMPGEWVLGFRISVGQVTEQTTFKFTI